MGLFAAADTILPKAATHLFLGKRKKMVLKVYITLEQGVQNLSTLKGMGQR